MAISHINVVGSDDELIVSWRGGSPSLSVFVSDDPDDPGTDIRAPDEAGRAVIARSPTRQYIHLFDPKQGFVVTAERCLPTDGPDNFRDLGGYPTTNGAYTRWGQVFRSDRLDKITAKDQALIEALGIATVYDLRSKAEVAAAPDPLPNTIKYVHLPMSSDVAQHRSMLKRILDRAMTKFDNEDMARGYLRMLESFGDYFIEVIREIIDGRKVLFHCTAGKDRTGVMAMVLLSLAGVTEPYLLDDYEISQQYRKASTDAAFREKIRAAGFNPDDYSAMWQSPRAVMRQTLDGLQQHWGSPRGYLHSIGVNDEMIAAARSQLCVAAN